VLETVEDILGPEELERRLEDIRRRADLFFDDTLHGWDLDPRGTRFIDPDGPSYKRARAEARNFIAHCEGLCAYFPHPPRPGECLFGYVKVDDVWYDLKSARGIGAVYDHCDDKGVEHWRMPNG
jgi:hypothetical protein